MNFKKIAGVLAFAAMLAGPIAAQNRTRFGGLYNAVDYAYGLAGTPGPLVIQTGNSSTGSASIMVQYAYTTLGDGSLLYPLSTSAPITIGSGAAGTLETVTPTGVSNCNINVYATCTVTATFSFVHGTGEQITTGSYGLQEAINAAHGGGFSTPNSGGTVLMNQGWASIGGTNATISAATAFSNVVLEDTRAGLQYWSMQPTTLTQLATPATQSASTIVFTAAPVGTWAASATFFCVTYVDGLGDESPCSASYSQTPTLNTTLNVTSPAASTGAVGWRMYAGTSAVTSAYLLPITAANCALTTLENVVAACAIGSNGQWSATFVTTTMLAPGALGVTNTNNPVPQSATTFAYQPSGFNPQTFRTNYGPFGTGAVASATASDLTPIGSFNLPAGFMNVIGRTIRVSGRILLTAGASSTLSIQLMTGWAGGVTAGLPVAVCNAVSGFVFATHAYTDTNFTCTMTVNAVGTTAVGSIMPESSFIASYAAGTLIPVGADTANAAVGSLGLFSQQWFNIAVEPLVAADTTVQLQSLHIEVLQ
jgi:hypothetical protein